VLLIRKRMDPRVHQLTVKNRMRQVHRPLLLKDPRRVFSGSIRSDSGRADRIALPPAAPPERHESRRSKQLSGRHLEICIRALRLLDPGGKAIAQGR
jgi:hypothetical protein